MTEIYALSPQPKCRNRNIVGSGLLIASSALPDAAPFSISLYQNIKMWLGRNTFLSNEIESSTSSMTLAELSRHPFLRECKTCETHCTTFLGSDGHYVGTQN